VHDFGDKRSTTWNQDDQATPAGLAPGKRTLTEMLPPPASGPEMPRSVSAPVQRKAAASVPVPVMPSGPRPTIHDLFGRVQRKAVGAEPDAAAVHASAQRGIATSMSPLPHHGTIQRAFGRHDISGIRAHSGPEASASSAAMGATAYAMGDHVVLGAGSDLHTVAHEAAHVVQQRDGVQLKGGVGEAGDTYEQHADQVADAVVAGRSAEPILDAMAGGGGAARAVQRKIVDATDTPLAEPKLNQLVEGFRASSEYLRLQRTYGFAKEKLDAALEKLAHGTELTVEIDATAGLLGDTNYKRLSDKIYDQCRTLENSPPLDAKGGQPDHVLRQLEGVPVMGALLAYPPFRNNALAAITNFLQTQPTMSISDLAAQVATNILIGETHDNPAGREFIVNNRHTLREIGIDTLVVEYDGQVPVGDVLATLVSNPAHRALIHDALTLQQLCDLAVGNAAFRPYLKDFMLSTFQCDVSIADVCIKALNAGFSHPLWRRRAQLQATRGDADGDPRPELRNNDRPSAARR